jgi:hypothetical protein
LYFTRLFNFCQGGIQICEKKLTLVSLRELDLNSVGSTHYQAGELSEAEAITALDHPARPESPTGQSGWLWTAIDPVSKFWLAAAVGDRGAEQVGQIVHQVVGRLKAGVTSLFLTDGHRAYEQPILSHFSELRKPVSNAGRGTAPTPLVPGARFTLRPPIEFGPNWKYNKGNSRAGFSRLTKKNIRTLASGEVLSSNPKPVFLSINLNPFTPCTL